MAIDRKSLIGKLTKALSWGESKSGVSAMTTLTPTDVPVILPFAATNPDLMTIDATTYSNGAIKFSIVDSNMMNYALNLATAALQGVQESGVAQWSVNVPYVQGALAAEIVGGISIVYQAIQPVAEGLDSPSGNPEHWQIFETGGGSSDGGNIIPLWNIDFEYNTNDIISYNGTLYKSLTAVNVGNVPSSSPTIWMPTVMAMPTWNVGYSYAGYDMVSYQGVQYLSQFNGNIGNIPTGGLGWVKYSLASNYILYSNYSLTGFPESPDARSLIAYANPSVFEIWGVSTISVAPLSGGSGGGIIVNIPPSFSYSDAVFNGNIMSNNSLAASTFGCYFYPLSATSFRISIGTSNATFTNNLQVYWIIKGKLTL